MRIHKALAVSLYATAEPVTWLSRSLLLVVAARWVWVCAFARIRQADDDRASAKLCMDCVARWGQVGMLG